MTSTKAAAVLGVSRDRHAQLAALLRLAHLDHGGMPDFDERAIRALARTGLIKHARANVPAPGPSGRG
jgi:hypothetical protein